jgi:SnoaL-like domain
MKHLAISPEEAGDRLAIRELVEAYPHCADRREAQGQMSLFTADTHFVVFLNAKDPKPSMEHSREALAPVFADLNKYDATTHFVVAEHDFHVDGRPCDRRSLLPGASRDGRRRYSVRRARGDEDVLVR